MTVKLCVVIPEALCVLLCMSMYKCHVYHLNKHSESAELFKQIKIHDAKSNMNKPNTSHQSEINKV